MRHRIASLRKLGVQIVIGDLGTGYSSLAYLRHLPIDSLKIDRSFISELGKGQNGQARSLVRSIVRLGHDLGVGRYCPRNRESAELETVAGTQCDLGQGSFLARPIPLETLRFHRARTRTHEIRT